MIKTNTALKASYGEALGKKVKPFNPQQRLQRNIKASITRIEKELAASKYTPIDFFKGAAILSRLVETLKSQNARRLKSSVSANGDRKYPLMAQLVRNEINQIEACLAQSCHKGCNGMLAKLKADGTLGSPFLKTGFARKLAA